MWLGVHYHIEHWGSVCFYLEMIPALTHFWWPNSCVANAWDNLCSPSTKHFLGEKKPHTAVVAFTLTPEQAREMNHGATSLVLERTSAQTGAVLYSAIARVHYCDPAEYNPDHLKQSRVPRRILKKLDSGELLYYSFEVPIKYGGFETESWKFGLMRCDMSWFVHFPLTAVCWRPRAYFRF